ncbi:hypothetical protein FH593_20575 (plasmid) [Leptospira interrogans]|uniref:Uncharacterized protein n=2 Tax=Leptospira interrogans TaxID=173 RepID=A0AAP9WFJ5_LEPIR|nr:hypothetical protein [Leptospira interrogans]EMN32878.1 hypothetical protein LEP1GSC083_0096 [Leptospira interrogans serovar Pyrogenes str. L0374]EKR34404.1 hypothetical protein LEP1GSC096_0021 [Leptospira interrogans serovar Hebdomadis str. R499]EMN38335.1 hypothetical protein LEP1GSC085_0018 [Leptospira interrogans str. L0996]EMN60292.1 hypothetical protein LEP1GSC092_0074 [Leptospira interrogans serovar Pyrogenes str. R168]KGE21831.1 hypothetical protein IQ65_22100 [Leptospira interrogan
MFTQEQINWAVGVTTTLISFFLKDIYGQIKEAKRVAYEAKNQSDLQGKDITNLNKDMVEIKAKLDSLNNTALRVDTTFATLTTILQELKEDRKR